MVKSRDCLNKWGSPSTRHDEGKYMRLYNLPSGITSKIKTVPKRIYCNEMLILPLTNALQNVIDRNLQHLILTWDGCFNIRKARGYNSWSLHSWGIAIDINAAWNGLGKEPKMNRELVKCFEDAGFDWGGYWKRKDGMHFQLKEI
jgi:hypothetical protein